MKTLVCQGFESQGELTTGLTGSHVPKILGFLSLKESFVFKVHAVLWTTCITRSESITDIYIWKQKQILVLFISEFVC